MSFSLVALAPQPPVEESGGPNTPVPLLATVPAPPGTKRLHFSWGLGNRISLCPLVDESPVDDAATAADDFDGEFQQQQQQRRRPAVPSSHAETPSASVVQW